MSIHTKYPNLAGKRLLLLNAMAATTATGVVMSTLAHAAQQHGMEPLVAYGRSDSGADVLKKAGIECRRYGSDIGVLSHGMLSRVADAHGLGSLMATRRLLIDIRRRRPHLVHLHNLHGYYLNYPMLFRELERMQIPVVWTLHDCWALTGHCAHFAPLGCNLWRSGCSGHCPGAKAYPSSWGLQRPAHNHRLKKEVFTSLPGLHLVGVSKWLDGIVSQSMLADTPHTQIYNGIDTGIFSPDAAKETDYAMLSRLASDLDSSRAAGAGNPEILKNKDTRILLAVAGKWRADKGIDDLAVMARMLPQGCRFVAAGLASGQQRNLPPEVVALPHIDNPRLLASLYARADAFVNPSHADTFPTVNLEALACGTPVATYPTGGSPEAVDDATGIVTSGADPRLLLEAALSLAGSKPQLSAACRNRATALFNRSCMTDNYMNLYNSLLK